MKLNHIESGIVERISELRVEMARYQQSGVSDERLTRFVELWLNPVVSDISDLKTGHALRE